MKDGPPLTVTASNLIKANGMDKAKSMAKNDHKKIKEIYAEALKTLAAKKAAKKAAASP